MTATVTSVERAHPSGAWRVSGIDSEGYRVEMTFYDYTKREAIEAWCDRAPTYWRDQLAKEGATMRRTFRHA